MMNCLLSLNKSPEEVCSQQCLHILLDKLAIKRGDMKDLRTAQLWLQYMDMVDILLKFLKAERTGNWDLHLQALTEMLPFLAASGHNLYTKSVHIYLQDMSKLENSYPNVYNSFKAGLHVVRRSDRFWGGLSTDLIIEQVLMRNLKSTGGLTRGRGMADTQCATWVLSMPACAAINEAIKELTGIKFISGDQHVDVSPSRNKRDINDISKLSEFLHNMSPFSGDATLHNIATGVTANKNVDVDVARSVGCKIIESMIGSSPENYTFKKSNTAVTQGSKTSVSVDGEILIIDPLLMFQRLVTVLKDAEDVEPQNVFTYELCTYPPSLFDAEGVLREATKASLADAIWKLLDNPIEFVPDGCIYVLDGGSLLQRIPWKTGQTYEEICQIYVNHVITIYGLGTTVVFDGYSSQSTTKDVTHNRRSHGNVGPTVHFTPGMTLKLKKESFLSNKTNKQQFIKLLSSKLQDSRIETIHSTGDADLLIVQTAISISENSSTTVVIGEDTDLLVLLCYHICPRAKGLYMVPQTSTKYGQRVWNIAAVRSALGPTACQHILFLHALLGCDTTSRLYGIGKGVCLKKFRAKNFWHKLRCSANQSSTSYRCSNCR